MAGQSRPFQQVNIFSIIPATAGESPELQLHHCMSLFIHKCIFLNIFFCTVYVMPPQIIMYFSVE